MNCFSEEIKRIYDTVLIFTVFYLYDNNTPFLWENYDNILNSFFMISDYRVAP